MKDRRGSERSLEPARFEPWKESIKRDDFVRFRHRGVKLSGVVVGQPVRVPLANATTMTSWIGEGFMLPVFVLGHPIDTGWSNWCPDNLVHYLRGVRFTHLIGSNRVFEVLRDYSQPHSPPEEPVREGYDWELDIGRPAGDSIDDVLAWLDDA